MNSIFSHARFAASVFGAAYFLSFAGCHAGQAQALPAPWLSAAVGDAAPVSALESAGGTFTVAAGGRDIQDLTDGFGFISQPMTGDLTITAHVVSVPHTNEWAKAGIMIRGGSGADAKNVFFGVTSAHELAFQHRDSLGGATTTAQISGAAPAWLRLQRVGTLVTAQTSPDGTIWSQVAGMTSFLPSAVFVGLATTSHQPGTVGTAVFDQVTVLRAAVQTYAPEPTAQVICHGDSLTAGYNASSGLLTATGTTYPGVLARALGPTWRVANIGTGGWPIGAMADEASTKVDPLFDPSLKQNVLIIFGGTNDLGGGHKSAETAFGELTAYCRARHAAHPWRILVVTPLVAAYPNVYPADFDAQMVKFDGLIRRDWPLFADGLIDAGADPRLGTPGAEHNPVYFSDKDFTHLTDAGYAIVGHAAALAVLSRPAQRPSADFPKSRRSGPPESDLHPGPTVWSLTASASCPRCTASRSVVRRFIPIFRTRPACPIGCRLRSPFIAAIGN